ncbi:Riboflavin-aldehyde forming enzyme [Mycena venus]|uniref:Riboflavin-aldehyde forming enzyme n=1 Tax=Mycena venus TaxID=2733690 RepID=A0A8H6YX70_9AGAR|nr:Riboflavin-aldehyde forming enzyme [Mycena venus]
MLGPPFSLAMPLGMTLMATLAPVGLRCRTRTSLLPCHRRTITMGAHCWQHLDVEYNGQHIDVTIGDLCPGCGTDDIDLSQGAFAALADLNLGRIPVQWHFK